MGTKRYLTAKEAADALDVSLTTLYAYVSRGLIRSEAESDDPRKRRYHASDVEKLLTRKAARYDPSTAAQGALHWGLPVLESALTLIDGGQLYYRGQSAVGLARQVTAEQVAALLWHDPPLAVESLFAPSNRVSLPPLPDAPLMTRLQVALALAAVEDYAAYDLRPESIALTGARILRLLTETVIGESAEGAIAETLARAWSPDYPSAAHDLNAALILCADHELNASSFAARVVAAAGSMPYAVVSAGIAALMGVRHGGISARVEAFMREVEHGGDPRQVIAERLRRGEGIPGFGQRLYPEGDPRGRLLIELAQTDHDDALIPALIEAVYDLIGERPTVDFGLCALARKLRLPSGAPLVLFTMGRSIGWIAHAIEQEAEQTLIRPRAKYVGNLPEKPQSD